MWQPELEAAAPEALATLQVQRLRDLVKRLFHRVPFYRAAITALDIHPRDISGPADLRNLPQTTRADLREQYPFGLLAIPAQRVVRLHATSGTRGKPTLVACSSGDLNTWADLCARMLVAAGCRRGDVWYVASGYGLFTGGLGAHYGAERVGAAVVPASSGNSIRLLQLMQDVPPAGIHCIPSYMLRLAEVAAAAGVEPRRLGLRYGSFGGETWAEPLRRRIEETFGLRAHDVYGLSECLGPGVAYECEARQGLHLSEDHFLAEIVDPISGAPVPEGREGELVLTSLTKVAMPLLRYRTGDLTRLIPGRCSCGRTLRRLARISGRADDMLTIRGVNLFPAEVERVLLQFPELSARHRLVVDRIGPMDTLAIETELAAPAPAAAAEPGGLAERVQEHLRAELGLTAAIHLLPPGMLPRQEGKAVRVVDRRPRP